MLDEHLRTIGQRRGLLEARLQDVGRAAAPDGSRKMVATVLLSLTHAESRAAVAPQRARAELFSLAPAGLARSACVEAAARRLDVAPRELEASLFADLPSEREVLGLTVALTPAELALRANMAFCQSLVFRATSLRLRVDGQARAIVRQARLGGLICNVTDAPKGEGAVLQVTGPLSIFHRTLLYGRALARLLPFLAWCPRFALEADVVVGGRALELRLSSPAPIFPNEEPRRFDSKLEEKFARDFVRAAPSWELLREPEPLRAGPTLIFPDFLARHRHDPQRQVWIEVIGFWTPEYLERKLSTLRAANLPNLVLCVDDALGCAEDRMPASASLVRFRRRIDAQDVLAAVERIVGADNRPALA